MPLNPRPSRAPQIGFDREGRCIEPRRHDELLHVTEGRIYLLAAADDLRVDRRPTTLDGARFIPHYSQETLNLSRYREDARPVTRPTEEQAVRAADASAPDAARSALRRIVEETSDPELRAGLWALALGDSRRPPDDLTTAVATRTGLRLDQGDLALAAAKARRLIDERIRRDFQYAVGWRGRNLRPFLESASPA